MRKDIKKMIISKKESAMKIVGSILNNTELGYDEFSDLFTDYLCEKFLLVKDEIVTDDFYEICRLSAEKASNLPKGMLDAAELASKCGGATTAMNKKVLFLLAVNREYEIKIEAEESAPIETFTDLKKLIYKKIVEKRETGYD